MLTYKLQYADRGNLMSTSMYEVFNWGHSTDDAHPKRFSLAIAGSEINIDDPAPTLPLPSKLSLMSSSCNYNSVNNNKYNKRLIGEIYKNQLKSLSKYCMVFFFLLYMISFHFFFIYCISFLRIYLLISKISNIINNILIENDNYNFTIIYLFFFLLHDDDNNDDIGKKSLFFFILFHIEDDSLIYIIVHF